MKKAYLQVNTVIVSRKSTQKFQIYTGVLRLQNTHV